MILIPIFLLSCVQIWYILRRKQYFDNLVNKAAQIKDCIIVVLYAYGLYLSIFTIMVTLSYAIIIILSVLSIIFATFILDKYLIFKMVKSDSLRTEEEAYKTMISLIHFARSNDKH